MLVLLTVHFVAAVLAPVLIRRYGPRAFAVLALVPAAAVGWAVSQTPTVLDGRAVVSHHAWVSAYHLDLSFRLSALSLTMVYVIAGIGALVLVYCASYFRAGEPGLGSFAGVLTAFVGTMLGLVLADDLIELYVFWELTTVFSYLLVGHKTQQASARRAALRALLVTTLGGLAMLAGILMLDHAAGTSRIAPILADPPSGTMVAVALVLMLLGAVTKSALVPFHFWLPGAMAAPTPVSAYLHAAAMVKAGVFLVALLAPTFAGVAPWRGLVVALGLGTMLLGAWRALRQHDLKLLLAFGTVSQLGFLTVLLGVGTRAAALAGLTMLIAHALFKAALFLTVGIIDVCAGTRDVRELSGFGRAAPVVSGAALLACASMAALPPLIGFVGKETAYTAFLTGTPLDTLVLVVLVAGSVLTFAYTARFGWGICTRKPGVPDREIRRPGAAFTASTVVLAVASLFAGVAVSWIDPLFGGYVHRYPEGGPVEHLALWHGFTAPLGLSALTVAAGLALFAAREPLFRLQARVAFPLAAERVHDLAVWALDRGAVHLTGLTQRGSLPVYLGVILLTLFVVPGGALLSSGLLGANQGGHLRPWDSPAQAIVVAVIVLAALFAIRARLRLAAVLLVSATGYGMAVLFALHGAPDLALTQLLVETVSTVIFVLVLRRLPARPVSRRPRLKVLHAGIGIATGLLISGLALVMTGVRQQPPVSVGMADAARQGGGENIVNVTLVDLRAWDTMGEISVLAVAATGVTSLIFLRRRNRALPRPDRFTVTGHVWAIPEAREREPTRSRPSPRRPGHWLSAGGTLAPERRSVIFEVITRLLFHPMIILSLYLTFSGHNTTGGGFAGGIVAGLALLVRYLAGGRYELGETAPVGAGLLLGLGLVLATGTGLAGLVFGGDVLGSAVLHGRVPLLGEIHFVTSTFFDLGVYLIVIGLVVDILRSFGAELDRQIDTSRAVARRAGHDVEEVTP